VISQQERERLGRSEQPTDWILAFEHDCCAAAAHTLSFVSLVHTLVMMGPGNTDDIEVPEDYDTKLLTALQAHKGLITKVRRVLRDDLRSDGGIENCGKIAHKPYSRWLLGEFLKQPASKEASV